MITFDQTIERAIETVENCRTAKKIQRATIVRDVYGKLLLFIEPKEKITGEELDNLKKLLQRTLGKYFQGNLYCSGEKMTDVVYEMAEEIRRLCWLYEERNGITWMMLERAVAKKAWIDSRGRGKAIWDYEDAYLGKMPKVVTFYSFKGGMGRTTALAATALNLAMDGKNVLAVDTDIEAPGLASLFWDESEIHSGTVDYLLEASVSDEEETIDMSDMLRQVNDPVLMEHTKGRIFVLPAGRIDDNYLQKLARIDYQDTIPENMKRQLARMIREAVRTIRQICSVDFVLLDARAGFHDMGGVITAQIPHGVVLFGKDSAQSWQGMRLVLKSIGSAQEDRPMTAIVDSACGGAGIVTAEEKKSFLEQSYTTFCEAYYRGDEEQPGLEAREEAHSPIYVPYYPALAGNVQLYTDGTDQASENVIQLKNLMRSSWYQEIEERIMMWFGGEGV